MIIATAGHIDHGKTSLVRRLTGVDTDRLPEEKKRGMSIDLGFAYLDLGDGAVAGFVDVPGHERFVRNMIAGVGGIDMALIVIAADDGPMPQTHEHIAILELLGVRNAAVAMTKIDRVDQADCLSAEDAIRQCLAHTPFANAPVFALSNLTGDGFDALQAHIRAMAASKAQREDSGGFRMAIDRAFTIGGAGLVVTGLVTSGTVSPGNHLLIAPQGLEARVRDLHAQNRKSGKGVAGQRCAINIAGSRLALDNVHRGMWLTDPASHTSVLRFDARVSLLSSETRGMRHWAPVHLHVGAADIPAHVALLDGKVLAPGQSMLAQIVAESPVSVMYSDRFILRDQSAQRTIGGGMVIDPFAPVRGRAKPQRLDLLAALENPVHDDALRNAVEVSPGGYPLWQFQKARNLDQAGLRALPVFSGLTLAGAGSDALAFFSDDWNGWLKKLVQFIEAAPANAQAEGVSEQMLAQAFRGRLGAQAISALLHAAAKRGLLQHASGGWRTQGAQASVAPADMALWQKLAPLIDDETLRPPSVAEMSKALAVDAKTIDGVLRRAARIGLAIQVADNRFFAPGRLRMLAEIAQELAAQAPEGFDARAFRDRSGIGRNLTIEVLEHFDRMGLTRRRGDLRSIRRPAKDLIWGRKASDGDA